MQPMIEKLWQLSIMSGGLLPLMAVLLLVTLAVIIERSYFFHRVLKSGLAMEHDLQLVEYQNVDKLEKLAAHYEGSLQRSIISSALASRGNDADTMDRHIEEAIMWQLPRIDKHVWVLDTAVTLAPLMGLLGTIVGMVHAFDILGISGTGGAASRMVTGGIAEALGGHRCGPVHRDHRGAVPQPFQQARPPRPAPDGSAQGHADQPPVRRRVIAPGRARSGSARRQGDRAQSREGPVMRRTRSSYFDSDRPRVEVIPMIDIMMFLLVFFVVISVRMIAGTGIDMDLPGSATTQDLKSSTITIGVSKTGDIVVDGKTVSPDALKDRLVALKGDKPVDVVLAGDKDVPLQVLLKVMDSVRGAGINQVGIAAKAEKR